MTIQGREITKDHIKLVQRLDEADPHSIFLIFKECTFEM